MEPANAAIKGQLTPTPTLGRGVATINKSTANQMACPGKDQNRKAPAHAGHGPAGCAKKHG